MTFVLSGLFLSFLDQERIESVSMRLYSGIIERTAAISIPRQLSLAFSFVCLVEYHCLDHVVSIGYSVDYSRSNGDMSLQGDRRSDEDVVLVFRPPENPAAQMAGITPFKSLRLRLDELLEWFKGLNVESIDLWIEGAWKAGNRTELFLSVEGKTGAKLTLRPYSATRQLATVPRTAETTQTTEASNAAAKEIHELKEK